ncbi:MAG: FAD-linked oxidase C-terminal domain-containing protein [Pseudomonadota bacterium]
MGRVEALQRNETGIAEVVAGLAAEFGERVQTGAAIREQHGHTTTWLATQAPDAVVFPTSTQEVASIVRLCARHKVPVIGFGIGSSLEGHVNAPAGGICVDFSQMNQILAVHPEDLDVVVQPGVTREQLNTYLRDQGLFFPIDPGANATLGGMAATRASGTNAVRYGTMRENVLSLEAVMPDGTVINTAQRAKKTSAGYDLTRLLVGSEGTLGLITAITLRLQGIPEAISAARCSFPSLDAACRAAMMTIQFGIPVARMELLDDLAVHAVNLHSKLGLPEVPLLLLEFHGSTSGVAEQAETFGSIAEDVGGTGFEWTASSEERNRLWKARHEMFWAVMTLKPGGTAVATDACVPISRLADCVTQAADKAKELGLLSPVVGHVGDGNFHMSPIIDKSDPVQLSKAEAYVDWLAKLAISMDGTCTGEHGIGQGKRPYLDLELGPAVRYMQAIKAALDPDGIMNPGKILPD